MSTNPDDVVAYCNYHCNYYSNYYSNYWHYCCYYRHLFNCPPVTPDLIPLLSNEWKTQSGEENL